jgi:hypothetical protein
LACDERWSEDVSCRARQGLVGVRAAPNGVQTSDQAIQPLFGARCSGRTRLGWVMAVVLRVRTTRLAVAGDGFRWLPSPRPAAVLHGHAGRQHGNSTIVQSTRPPLSGPFELRFGGVFRVSSLVGWIGVRLFSPAAHSEFEKDTSVRPHRATRFSVRIVFSHGVSGR